MDSGFFGAGMFDDVERTLARRFLCWREAKNLCLPGGLVQKKSAGSQLLAAPFVGGIAEQVVEPP